MSEWKISNRVYEFGWPARQSRGVMSSPPFLCPFSTIQPDRVLIDHVRQTEEHGSMKIEKRSARRTRLGTMRQGRA